MSQQLFSSWLTDKRCWTFSIAVDRGSVIFCPYLDIRARNCYERNICNKHVFSILLHESYLWFLIFDLVSKVLISLVDEEWKVKLIGIAIDGAVNMVWKVSGVVTMIQNVCTEIFCKVWCVTHQLELSAQSGFEQYDKDNFQVSLFQRISYFRCQTN